MTQLPLALELRPALGRDDFLVAPCNAAAVAWIDRWPRWPGPALALYGPPASGKTHLAEVWRTRSGAVAIAPEALAPARVPQLLGAGRAASVDGADGAEEEALCHLYNLLAERDGQLLLAAREPPARWNVRLADLRSRLRAAAAVAIGAPDDALLGALLIKLFADRQIRVGEDVIGYLLAHVERSFAGMQAAVAALDQAALAEKRAVTVRLARDVLIPVPDRG